MNSDLPFDKRIRAARAWERAIFRWLIEAKGYPAINLFEWPTERHEGPRLHVPSNGSHAKVLLGDIFVPRVLPAKRLHGFLDIKARKGFCWSKIEADWQVSIQLKQYKEYLTSRKILDEDFWIFFFLQCAKPSPQDVQKEGCPKECPRGLFAIEVLDIEKLGKGKTHAYGEDKYIAKSALKKLASYEDIVQFLEHDPQEDQDEESSIFDI